MFSMKWGIKIHLKNEIIAGGCIRMKFEQLNLKEVKEMSHGENVFFMCD